MNVGANVRAGWDNVWTGVGAFIPLSPFESLKVFGFQEIIEGNRTRYYEAGVHLRMGVPYAAIVSLAAAFVIGKTLGAADPVVAPIALALIAFLIGPLIHPSTAILLDFYKRGVH